MTEVPIHTVTCDQSVTDVPKTVNRCDLVIKCEQDDCPGNAAPWVCVKCHAVVEYGLDDENVYCNCGMTKLSSCKFECSQKGSMYSDEKKLKAALQKLKPPVTFTILLLGETNVGKSTWINAFANYLTYPTLDAAVETRDLITLIPNEFTYTDDDNECTVIRNGPKCEDENFTAGLKNVDILKSEEDRIANINDKIKLEEKDLMFDIVGLEREDLAYPRTVCTNEKCITTGSFNGSSVINYTQWCHDHCYLNGVTTEVTNNEALKQCQAMNNDVCTECSHGYEEHMHITYQYNQVSKKVENQDVRNMIRTNASTRDIKARAIQDLQNLIGELKDEHAQIEKIAAKFGVFLQQNSITSYNHARAEYLTFHINEQKKLTPEFRDEKLIAQLELSLKTYNEEVNTLIKAMQSGDESQVLDISTIESSIKQLYGLKHSGPIIKNVGRSAIKASTRTRREVSHRIKSSKNKKNSSISSGLKKFFRFASRD